MILSRILYNYLICLSLTVIIEAVFAFISGIRTGYGQAVVLLTNIITNTALNSVLTVVSFYLQQAYYFFLIPLEILIVIIEGLIYKKTLIIKMNCFLLSFILNFCSYFIGTVILKIF